MALPVVALGAGVASGLAATALSIVLLRRSAVFDVPNQRSSHATPTVRGGGVGLIAGCLVAVAVGESGSWDRGWLAVVLVAGLGFAALGLLDDLTASQPALRRLGFQVLIAAAAVTVGRGELPRGRYVAALVAVASALWIVSYVNAFNFMDGINGISVVQAVVAGAAIAVAAHHQHKYALEVAAVALVAGAVGFAPYNFGRAKVFLGDVGSYFAGAWLAGLVLVSLRSGIPREVAVAPVALYATDTGVTLIRRVCRGESWLSAHRQHVYQRLVDLGWSHTATSGFVLAMIAACSMLGFVSFTTAEAWRAAADCGIVLVIAMYLMSPAAIGRRRPRMEPSGR